MQWLAVLGVIIVALFVLTSVSKRNNSNFFTKYVFGNNEFFISGKKSSFSIRKNNNIEFLVENGEILACKDKNKSDKFVYYGGENSGAD